MTDAAPLACDECGAPGFVVTPATQDKPARVLCGKCFAERWAAAISEHQARFAE